MSQTVGERMTGLIDLFDVPGAEAERIYFVTAIASISTSIPLIGDGAWTETFAGS